ncbi:hypothetical protein MMC28_003049 [Mycoblastus sanguinarius]|nr:hypothetical protein [Mycoblastus sanguinarius]
MVTKTIYKDRYIVVVDIGAVPPTVSWLETTYLIDASGHTTAIIAQTDQPTSGVSLQPVPFTLVNAQVSGVTPATAAPSPSAEPSKATRQAESSTPPHFPSTISIIVPAIVGLLGTAALAVILFLLLRRSKKNRLRTDGASIHSVDSSAGDSRNAVERLVNGSTTPQERRLELSPKARIVGESSWETFLKEVESKYERFDESTVFSSEANGSRLCASSREDECGESASRHEDRYNPPRRKHRTRPPTTKSTSLNTMVDYKAAIKHPSLRIQTPCKTKTLEDRSMDYATIVQPPSILKRPARINLGSAEVPSGPELGDQMHKATFVTKRSAAVRKGVRFGEDQIREFGGTPLPSRSGSSSSVIAD